MNGLKILTGAFVMTLFTATLAVASEGHALPWDNFAYRVVTFAVVIGIIWYAAGKKIADFFTGRQTGIEQELTDLESRKTEARKNLADVEQRIANISAEREAIINEYRAQGEAMKVAIIEKAEKSAAQITEQAVKTADSEIKQAMEEMRSEMADLIIDAAEKMLAEKLSGEDHEKLVDKYLTKVVLN